MSEASRKSGPKSCGNSGSAISSPASGAGLTLFDSLDGLTTESAGPEVAPVPVSRALAKEKGLTTLVTSGRSGIPSSASVALESSLVNRLMQRLDTAGSTLFRQTWKRRSTPLRRRYWEHGPGWLDPLTARSVAEAGATRGFWADCDWWHARDGKYRPIEPGLFPLAHGAANRVLKLRGYGDAIVPQVAAEFIRASAEILEAEERLAQ